VGNDDTQRTCQFVLADILVPSNRKAIPVEPTVNR